MLCDDLYDAIAFEFPKQNKIVTPLDEERSYHTHFIEYRYNNFIGRLKLLENLELHAEGLLKKGRLNSEGGILPLVVVGDPGSGKSSVVTAFAQRYLISHPNTFVLPHVVGASPKSTDIRFTLSRFIEEIANKYNLECIPEARDYVSIKNAFFAALQSLSKILVDSDQKMLIVMDGVNQFDSTFGAHGMDWLPVVFPPNIRCIISTTEEGAGIIVLKSLRARERHPPELVVSALSLEEREEIVRAHLSTYRKKLTPNQMENLMNKRDSSKPLYLLIACEELRFCGLYGMDGSEIDKKIGGMPSTIPKLFADVLDRVERDMEAWAKDFTTTNTTNNNFISLDEIDGNTDPTLYLGSTLVKYALSYIECSRHGMKEAELLELLAPPGKDILPQAIWARLFRSLELYLRPQGEDGEGTLGFFHGQLAVAVKNRYLRGSKMRIHICGNLSSYYKLKADPKGDLSWDGEYSNALKELPYFYFQSYDLQGLQETLGNLNFIKARCKLGVFSIEALMRDYQDAQSFFKDSNYALMKDVLNQYHTDKDHLFGWLSEFLIFISSQKPKLQANPEQIFQIALNQPDTSAPYVAALRYIQDGWAPISWIDFLNKPTENKLVAEFAGFNSKVTSIGLNPDGLTLTVGCCDGTLRVIDSITGELIREMIAGGHSDEITSLSYDIDGAKLLSASKDNSIIVWDAIGGTRLGICTDHVRAVTFAKFTPNSTLKKWTVVSGSLDMSLRLFSLRLTETEELEFVELWIKDWMSSPALSAAFTEDSSVLATGCSDGNIIFWDIRTPSLGMVELVKYHGHSQAIQALAFSHHGWNMISGSDDKTIKYWELPSTDELQKSGPIIVDTVNAHSDSLTYLTYSPGDDVIASCGKDNKVYIWNTRTKEKIFSIVGHSDIITCAQFANEGKQILTSSNDATIKRWDITFSPLLLMHQSGNVVVERIVALPDSITPAQRRKLNRQANRDIMDEIEASPVGRHTSSINTIRFSYNGKYCITGSTDLTAKIWTVPDGVELAVLVGHVDSVNDALFFNNDSSIMTADKAGNIMLWYFENFKHYMMIETDFGAAGVLSGLSDGVYGLTCIEVSCDNNYLIAGYQDGQLRKFTISDGKQMDIQDHEEFSHDEEISSIKCTNDQRTVTADIKGFIKVWDKNLKLIMQLSGCKDKIMGIRLMKGDSRIVAISKDRSVKFYDRYHKIESPVIFPDELSNSVEPLSGSISYNCDYVVSSLSDKTIYAISINGDNKGEVIGSFITFGDASCSDIYSEKEKADESVIGCGDTTGKLYILKVQHLDKYKNSSELNRLPVLEKSKLKKPQIIEEYRAENFSESSKPTPSPAITEKKGLNNSNDSSNSSNINTPLYAPNTPINEQKMNDSVKSRLNTLNEAKMNGVLGRKSINRSESESLRPSPLKLASPHVTPRHGSEDNNTGEKRRSSIIKKRTSLSELITPTIKANESNKNSMLLEPGISRMKSDRILTSTTSSNSADGYMSSARPSSPCSSSDSVHIGKTSINFQSPRINEEYEPFSIVFPNNNREKSIAIWTEPPLKDDEDLLIGEKILNSFQIKVSHINYLICTFGGASGLNPTLMPILRSLIDQGVMNASKESGAVMIDGGTDSGIMQIVGRGKGKLMRKMKLIGVCPQNLVKYPGKIYDNENGVNFDELTDLEPHHSHFVLVKSNEWGGETSTMFGVIKYLMQTVKSCGILVNGGSITVNEAVNAVKAKMPLIIIEGSARTADTIASSWRIKQATNAIPDLEDSRIKYILENGNIYLYNIKAGSDGLTSLILQVLGLRSNNNKLPNLTLPSIGQRQGVSPAISSRQMLNSPIPQKRAVMIVKRPY